MLMATTPEVATTTDRGYLDLEMEQLVDEIDAIAANTKFNNQAVLTGAAFSFYSDIDIAGTAMSTVTAAVSTGLINVSTGQVNIDITNASIGTQAMSAIKMITSAIGQIDSKRAQLGALSNRLDHTIDNLTNVVMNTIASKSRIEDADFAAETTNMTRNSVLQQAATSMLAQANASKSSILSLIQQ